jgi:predicted dehydrogenase
MSKPKPIGRSRFAVFGAGFWAQYQLAAWQELKRAECVAIYNRTLAKAERLAHQFGVPAFYDDPEELLAREQLDFVDVITDVDTHSQFVHFAAQRKLAVICQKPMAATLAQAGKMVAVCRQARVPLFIHENWRWQAPIRALKKVLDAGTIGVPNWSSSFLPISAVIRLIQRGFSSARRTLSIARPAAYIATSKAKTSPP